MAALALVLGACATLTEVSAPTAESPAGRTYEQRNAGPTVSGDGRYSVYYGPRSVEDSPSEVFRRDNQAGTTVRVSSDANGAPIGGDAAAISRDGRYVVFRTTAALVPSDTNRDLSQGRSGVDYYVRDMNAPASYELVSIGPAGAPIVSEGADGLNQYVYTSASGRYVAFQFVRDAGRSFDSDIYIRDRQAGTTTAVDGGYANLAGLSGDGMHVGVDELSACTGICPAYPGEHVTDWQAGTSLPIGCEAGGAIAMSDDGRYVATWQSGHVTGCTAGVARYDRQAGGAPLMATPTVPEGSWGATKVVMSADGTRVVYDVTQPLEPSDVNGFADVYLTDFDSGERILQTRSPLNALANGNSFTDGLSSDGAYVQFATAATNLIVQDTDSSKDMVLTPADRPTMVNVLPPSVARGTSHSITVAAHPVTANATVTVMGDGVTTGPVTVINGVAALTTVTVASGATPGPRDVVITNPGPYGNASAWCFGCLTVT